MIGHNPGADVDPHIAAWERVQTRRVPSVVDRVKAGAPSDAVWGVGYDHGSANLLQTENWPAVTHANLASFLIQHENDLNFRTGKFSEDLRQVLMSRLVQDPDMPFPLQKALAAGNLRETAKLLNKSGALAQYRGSPLATKFNERIVYPLSPESATNQVRWRTQHTNRATLTADQPKSPWTAPGQETASFAADPQQHEFLTFRALRGDNLRAHQAVAQVDDYLGFVRTHKMSLDNTPAKTFWETFVKARRDANVATDLVEFRSNVHRFTEWQRLKLSHPDNAFVRFASPEAAIYRSLSIEDLRARLHVLLQKERTLRQPAAVLTSAEKSLLPKLIREIDLMRDVLLVRTREIKLPLALEASTAQNKGVRQVTGNKAGQVSLTPEGRDAQRMGRFRKDFPKGTPTSADINNWIADRLIGRTGEPLSASSVATHFSAFDRAWPSQVQRRYQLVRRPTRTPTRALTPDESAALKTAVASMTSSTPAIKKLSMELILDHGLRPGEPLLIKAGWYNPINNTIKFPAGVRKAGGKLDLHLSKTQGEEVARLIQELHLQPGDPLLPSGQSIKAGRAYKEGSLSTQRRSFEAARLLAGIPKEGVTPRSARVAVGTRAVIEGTPSEGSRALGHASLKTVKRYYAKVVSPEAVDALVTIGLQRQQALLLGTKPPAYQAVHFPGDLAALGLTPEMLDSGLRTSLGRIAATRNFGKPASRHSPRSLEFYKERIAQALKSPTREYVQQERQRMQSRMAEIITEFFQTRRNQQAAAKR